jgi:hypothetical protein
MSDLEQKVQALQEEFFMAGGAIFDENILGSPNLDGVGEEQLESIRNTFSLGYSFGAISVLKASFVGTVEKEPEPIVQTINSKIITGNFL